MASKGEKLILFPYELCSSLLLLSYVIFKRELTVSVRFIHQNAAIFWSICKHLLSRCCYNLSKCNHILFKCKHFLSYCCSFCSIGKQYLSKCCTILLQCNHFLSRCYVIFFFFFIFSQAPIPSSNDGRKLKKVVLGTIPF